jgi:hypothetical protein
MSDTTQTQNGTGQRDTVAHVVMTAMQDMAQANKATETAIIALSSILVASAATGQIPPRAMAAAVSALTAGRPDAEELRGKVAAYVSMIAGMSEKLPGALANAAAAEEKAKGAKPAKGKSN